MRAVELGRPEGMGGDEREERRGLRSGGGRGCSRHSSRQRQGEPQGGVQALEDGDGGGGVGGAGGGGGGDGGDRLRSQRQVPEGEGRVGGKGGGREGELEEDGGRRDVGGVAKRQRVAAAEADSYGADRGGGDRGGSSGGGGGLGDVLGALLAGEAAYGYVRDAPAHSPSATSAAISAAAAAAVAQPVGGYNHTQLTGAGLSPAEAAGCEIVLRHVCMPYRPGRLLQRDDDGVVRAASAIKPGTILEVPTGFILFQGCRVRCFDHGKLPEEARQLLSTYPAPEGIRDPGAFVWDLFTSFLTVPDFHEGAWCWP